MAEAPIFRAVKRRKHLHKQGSMDPTTDLLDDEAPSQIIKSRHQPRARLQGVQFSNQKSKPNEPDNSDLTPTNASQQNLEPTSSQQYGINSRFIGSATGQVVNVDKHMTAYVVQQMAKKHPTVQSISSPSSTALHPRSHYNDRSDSEEDDASSRSTSPATSPPPPPPPSSSLVPSSTTTSSFHPLAEIDLSNSPSTTSTNAAKPPSRRQRPRRPRLGRDGKPLPPRPRKRRDSDDIERDGLVEQVLHESAASATTPYGPVTSIGTGAGTGRAAGSSNVGESGVGERESEAVVRQGNNEALDEKMAMEFQQQFLDAMAERQQRHAGKSSGGGAGKTKTGNASGVGGATTSQGPRLGGGRSARAKLAAAMQVAAAEAAGGKDAGRK